MLPLLYTVIPCFNVSAVLPFAVKFYEQKLSELAISKRISTMSRILLIDNGSDDGTWDTILKISDNNPLVSGVKLGRYSGFDNAVVCGLRQAERFCDIAVVADPLCRKDINAIDRMIEEYNKGFQTVIGAKKPLTPAKDGFFTRFIRSVVPASISKDYGFFLVSKPVIAEICRYGDSEINLGRIIDDMNFKSSTVFYGRRNTFDYKNGKLLPKIKEKFLSFFNSFLFPVHIIFIVGGILSAIFTLALVIMSISCWLGFKQSVGSVFIYLLASLQLFSIGFLGEYIIKITGEIKKHPSYTVVETTKPADE